MVSQVFNKCALVYVILVCILRLLSLSGVLQWLVLVPLISNTIINYLCYVINHSNCPIFANDLQIYRVISSPSDCIPLQSDIAYVHE
jgi:hypothetical protein